MRGAFADQGGLFSYISPEARVPANHPLRKIRELVRDVLSELNRSLGRLYASEGRPSIPPEQLLSALLLQVFYGIRSERQLMEQLDYNLLYRWFVGLSPDDPVWDPSTFTKNRDRLQNGEVFTKFMSKLLNHPQVKPLLSDEHFSVDGTLIEAWASQKSFRPRDGSGDDDDGANFHGQKRKNDTHASTSDPDSRLYRKAAGREAKLCYMGHATMENRHGLAVAGMVTHANGTAERRASEIMLKAKSKAALESARPDPAMRPMTGLGPSLSENDNLLRPFIRFSWLKSRASAPWRRDRWPVSPTRRLRRRSCGCHGDGFGTGVP
jgi:transposase